MKRSFFHTIASFFAFLCVVFIPFPFNITKIQLSITDFIFGRLIGVVSKNVFGKTLTDTRVHSDSVSMYILILLLFIFSILTGILLLRLKKWLLYRDRVVGFIYRLIFYYLALQLLKYGLDKIFKIQFYVPEPNTLFTPMGNVSKDLLYWSSMGTSHFYNVFLGSLEVLAAVFILIKRTRLIGLLMSLAIMVNVVAVNFGFDIGVKLYSLFLLFLTVYLLAPYMNRMYQFLILRKTVFGKPAVDSFVLFQHTFFSSFLKWLVVGIIFLEAFYPFIRAKNFNGDMAERPYLHGAYEVRQIISETDTMAAVHSPVKRFFIHRDGYMIFQNQEDDIQDYKLSYEKDGSAFILTDYKRHKTLLSFNYQQPDSILTLQYFSDGKEYQLRGKAINWKKLPALQKGFHWTVDGR